MNASNSKAMLSLLYQETVQVPPERQTRQSSQKDFRKHVTFDQWLIKLRYFIFLPNNLFFHLPLIQWILSPFHGQLKQELTFQLNNMTIIICFLLKTWSYSIFIPKAFSKFIGRGFSPSWCGFSLVKLIFTEQRLSLSMSFNNSLALSVTSDLLYA